MNHYLWKGHHRLLQYAIIGLCLSDSRFIFMTDKHLSWFSIFIRDHYTHKYRYMYENINLTIKNNTKLYQVTSDYTNITNYIYIFF